MLYIGLFGGAEVRSYHRTTLRSFRKRVFPDLVEPDLLKILADVYGRAENRSEVFWCVLEPQTDLPSQILELQIQSWPRGAGRG